MSKALPFPSRNEAPLQTAPELDLPGPRIWKPSHLADFLGFSVHWVYKRTAGDAEDPIPRIPGAGQLRFDTHSPVFREWIARQLGYIDIGETNE